MFAVECNGMPKVRHEASISKPYHKKKRPKALESDNECNSGPEPMDPNEDETDEWHDELPEQLSSKQQVIQDQITYWEFVKENNENKHLDELLSGKITALTHNEIAPLVKRSSWHDDNSMD
jgi:hypothetical protein